VGGSPETLRLAFAGGGTGGHIVPGLHLLERSLAGDVPAIEDLLWFTSGRSVEEHALRSVPLEQPLERVILELEPRRGGAPSLPRLFTRTPGAVLRARRALRRHRSSVLLGLGGFTTLPAVLAARSLGIPVALLEINASPGRATRHLAPTAARIYHAWSGTLPASGVDSRNLLTGAPVAPSVRAVGNGETDRRAARTALGFDADRPLLVILGGSQGAQSLNTFVTEHLDHLLEGGLQLLHQCGPGKLGTSSDSRVAYRIEEYLSPIAPALAAATIVLCRGGASTLAEVAAARIPAWVVPYPHHPDRHQERNARELGEGVRVVSEEQLDARLVEELLSVSGESGGVDRENMVRALAEASPGDAAAELLRDLLRVGAG
jgi:UDP-N-acetylglucosamine:LPS N-acetylglucosamine transferase